MSNLVLILLWFIAGLCQAIIQYSSGSPPSSNVLYVYKDNPNPLAFNLRINGKNYYPTSQEVLYTGQAFQFMTNETDVIEIIFTTYSDFGGSYQIIKDNIAQIYGSNQPNFYLINQCSSVVSCDLNLESFGTFDGGVTISIFINNEPKIVNYSGGSQTISIKKNDSINVKVNGLSFGFYGTNFTTINNGNIEGSVITWYNMHFTTQVLVQTAYFYLPLYKATLYEQTIAPVQLISYPDAGNYTVEMLCNDVSINTKVILSNTPTNQSFPILSNLATKNCFLKLSDLIYNYQKMPVTIKSQSPVTLGFSTLSSSTYNAGTNVPIRLASSREAGSFMVQLTCGSLPPVIRLITSNIPAQNFLIPDYYYGVGCIFNVSYPRKSSNTLKITVIGGTIKFNTPQNNTRITAGTYATIDIASYPSADSFTVQLDCGGTMKTTTSIQPNTIFPQYFPVPNNFSGVACNFTVINYPSYYYKPYPAIVTIAQPVNFTYPSSNGSYIVNTGFDVLLSAEVNDNAYPVTVTQQCGALPPQTYTNIKVGTNFTAIGPSGFVGSCTFSSTNNSIYNAASPNVTINIGKGSLALTSPLTNDRITAGTDAGIKIAADPGGNLFTVQLDCGGTMKTSIDNFAPNATITQPFKIPDTFYGSNCTFEIINYPNYYNATNPVTVTISQPVSFSSPVNASTSPVNTLIQVAPIANAIIPNNTITIIQECNPNNITQYPNIVVGSNLYVMPPLNYTGPCTFSSLQTGLYNAASPNVTIEIIKGTIKIHSPSSGDRIAAGSNAQILITAVPNIDTLVLLLDCGVGMSATASIKPNTPQYFLVPDSFYGTNCSFSVIDYPDIYSVPSSVPVTITQQLIWSSPVNGSIIYRPDPIPILLTPGYLNTLVPVTLNFTCNSTTSIFVTTTVPKKYQYTSAFFGYCELSVSDAPGYFETSKLLFSLKDQLKFEKIPSFIVNGQDFVAQIDTVSAPIPGFNTIDLGLFCKGQSAAFAWFGITLNDPVSLRFDDPEFTSGPYKCEFRTLPNEVYEQISSNTLVLTPLTPQELKHFTSENGYTTGSRWIPLSRNYTNYFK